MVPRRFRVLALALSMPLLAPAQSPPPVAVALGQSCGVTVHDGVPHAGGPRYRTEFRASGPVYTPLVGAASRADASGPVDVQFTFLEARVGSVAIATGGDVGPQVDGLVVSYSRGAVVETYEARPDGVKQSFVLAQRPAANGDLLVRGRITTALPLLQNTDDEVRFARPDGAGVTFGAVLGIDRDGATVRGTMRCRGDELELSLPASFVQSARYPLVLDPLLGTAFVVGDDPLHDDRRPAIAYDAGTDRFLVVWAVFFPPSGFGSGSCDIRGQFVNAGGGTIGNQLLIATGANPTARPKIAAINQSDRFLVAWTGATGTAPFLYSGVIGRAIDAGNGAMSNVVSLYAPLALVADIDAQFGLGGDGRAFPFAGTRALLACRRLVPPASPSSNDILALRVQVGSTGDPVPESVLAIASSSNLLDDVAVSAHCGSGGRWVVTFGQSITSMAGPMQRLYGQVVAASGSLCGTPALVVNAGSSGDVDEPAVATRDGSEFVFAWHDATTAGVRMRRGVVSGACGSAAWAFDAIVSPLSNPGPAHSPALAFVKDKYLLAWQQNQSGWRVLTRAFDPATCVACGREERVDSPVVSSGTPALASAFEGGDSTSELALVAWCEGNAVKARNWELHRSPSITSLGGGCGISGFDDYATYGGQPQLGDGTFAVSLFNPTAPVLGLIVGFSQVAVPCGPCTLVAAPDVVIATGPSLSIPIPCDASLLDAELYTQWLQVRTVGCPILPTLGLSNCLRFTISE